MPQVDAHLFDVLRTRRSRRVGAGMRHLGGPLSHVGTMEPAPLSEEETAALVFAGSGLTGGALFDWDLSRESGGASLATLPGRTVPSAEAVHAVTLFVVDDNGVWLMPRPANIEPGLARQASALAAGGDYLGAWQLTRVRVLDHRPRSSLEWPNNIEGNRWSLFAPGTTTFLPVVEHSFFLINALLSLMDEKTAMGILDDRRMFLPAGVGHLMRRKGGHLDDDPSTLRTIPLTIGERITTELAAVETGAMVQNLALAAEAIGLGGFTHFANTDFGHQERTWFDELGFTVESIPLSRLFGVPLPARAMLRMKRQDVLLRVPIGLEIDGSPVLRSYRPPYFSSMRAAVRAVADHKVGEAGTYRRGITEGRWRNPEAVAGAVEPISDKAFEATASFCEYVWGRYRRFPLSIGVFHTLVAFQVAHLDLDFYAQHYREDAVTEAHRQHMIAWHSKETATTRLHK